MNTIMSENGISYVLSTEIVYYPILKYDATNAHINILFLNYIRSTILMKF